MRWQQPRVPDVKGVFDKFQIFNRTLQRNVSLIQGFGTPMTSYRNMSITPQGTFPENATKCYCWSNPIESGGTTSNQTAQPDRTHFLCGGTGILDVAGKGGGYQKFGYREHVFGTPSKFTLDTPNLIISGGRNSNYVISGSSMNGTITTERLTLEKFKAVDYFLINDEIDANHSKVEYFYSTNDITWIPLVIIPYPYYSTNKIACKMSVFNLPEGSQYIRFRIILRKRFANSPSPKWNSIRFRYRQSYLLKELDPRFDISIPAFIASRDQTEQQVEGSAEHGGWITRFTNRYRTLPDTDIENADVVKFLQGTFVGLTFEAHDVTKFSYGEDSQILHRGFEANLIRDGHDVLKIVHYLL